MNSPKKLYRQFNTDSQNQDEKNIPVCTELFHVYEEATGTANQLLSQCREYKSLEDHALAYIRSRQKQHNSTNGEKTEATFFDNFLALISFNRTPSSKKSPIPDQEFNAVKRQLETFVNGGMLIAKSELQLKIQTAVSDLYASPRIRSQISILSIPTANHGAILVRYVESHLAHFQQSNRSCRLHIVDDSDESIQPGKNRKAVRKLCKQYEADLLWIDKSYRAKLAHKIAELSTIPKEVTQFALLGDSRFNFQVGAARNTLLLLAAGTPSVQVDDDTLCQLIPSPWMDNGVALSTEEPQQFRFDEDINLSAGEGQKEEIQQDLLSLHEKLLGKHPGDLIKKYNEANIDLLSSRKLLQKLHYDDTHIAVTFTGAVGDSGMQYHWQRLCLDGDSYQHFINGKNSYQRNLCTRQIFRSVPQLTIGDTPFCMGMHMGLNSEQFLPPFTPLLRNEDGIFGQLLNLCFKQACQGYIPYAIRHDPPGRPSHVDTSQALSVGPLRTNDILLAILLSLNGHNLGLGLKPSENLPLVGSYLYNLSQISISKFEARLACDCLQLIRIRISYLEQYLNKRIDAPTYWQNDIRKVISNFQELIQPEIFYTPCDLSGNTSERLALLQELIGKFGQVLIHWPAIWETAKKLREQEGFKDIGNRNC